MPFYCQKRDTKNELECEMKTPIKLCMCRVPQLHDITNKLRNFCSNCGGAYSGICTRCNSKVRCFMFDNSIKHTEEVYNILNDYTSPDLDAVTKHCCNCKKPIKACLQDQRCLLCQGIVCIECHKCSAIILRDDDFCGACGIDRQEVLKSSSSTLQFACFVAFIQAEK